MKIEPEFRWVNETDNNKPLTIAGYNHADKMLFLRNGIELIQMNVFGKNFNFLYNTFGNETEDWNGKIIKLKSEFDNKKGKNIRTIYT